MKKPVGQKANSENRDEGHLALAREAVNEKNRPACEEEKRPGQTGAASCLNEPRSRRLHLDVVVNESNEGACVLFAMPTTRQALSEVNGALWAQSLAARLAATDCLFFLVIV